MERGQEGVGEKWCRVSRLGKWLEAVWGDEKGHGQPLLARTRANM